MSSEAHTTGSTMIRPSPQTLTKERCTVDAPSTKVPVLLLSCEFVTPSRASRNCHVAAAQATERTGRARWRNHAQQTIRPKQKHCLLKNMLAPKNLARCQC